MYLGSVWRRSSRLVRDAEVQSSCERGCMGARDVLEHCLWQAEASERATACRYDHDEAWHANMRLFKHFTDVTQGVRRLGAAAVDLCHVALGVVDAYWEYRLKPWDVAAGVRITSGPP